MSRPIVLGAKALDKISRGAKRALIQAALTDGTAPPNRHQIFWEGELTTACTKPTNGKNAATTCKAKEWVPVVDDTHDPKYLEIGTVEFTLVNRSKTLSASVGTYVIWVRVKNEWRIIWADC